MNFLLIKLVPFTWQLFRKMHLSTYNFDFGKMDYVIKKFLKWKTYTVMKWPIYLGVLSHWLNRITPSRLRVTNFYATPYWKIPFSEIYSMWIFDLDHYSLFDRKAPKWVIKVWREKFHNANWLGIIRGVAIYNGDTVY